MQKCFALLIPEQEVRRKPLGDLFRRAAAAFFDLLDGDGGAADQARQFMLRQVKLFAPLLKPVGKRSMVVHSIPWYELLYDAWYDKRASLPTAGVL